MVGGLNISIIIDDDDYEQINRNNWADIMNIETESFYDISVSSNLEIYQYKKYAE